MAAKNGTDSTSEPAAAPAQKRRSRAWIWVLVTVVVVVGAAAGGAVAGTKWLAKHRSSVGKAAASENSEPETDVVPETVPLGDIVVDVRSKEGGVHHLKVGVSVQLKHGTELEQAKLLVPKGREAVIFCLRSKSFEELTATGTFDKVVAELNDKVLKAFGEKRAKRILVTDYLSQ